jgi:hypothetical protein
MTLPSSGNSSTTSRRPPALVLPRHGTKRTVSRPTLGPRVAETARLLGKPLMPHQKHIVNIALECYPGTRIPAYRMVIIVMPRQQGKTELMLPLMTHRCTGFGEDQKVLYTAQTGEIAREKWRDVHLKRLEKSPLRTLFTPRLRAKAEAMIWVNGSMWSPIATTKKTGGTGDTLNLGVIDEAWSRVDSGVELAMRPAMMTQENAQFWICSMVPGLTRAQSIDSKYLREKMTIGRELVKNNVNEGIAYFEFSAPTREEQPDIDPGNPDTWYMCMPALGRTVTERVIAEDYRTMDLVDFCAEYLGWWPQENTPTWTVIREGTWSTLFDPLSQPFGGLAIAVSAPEDRSRAWIGACGKRVDGDYHIEVLEPGQEIASGTRGLDWLQDRVVDICNRNDPLCVVVDPRSPAASEIIPLRGRGIEVLTPNVQQYAASCGHFYDCTGNTIPPLSEEDDGDERGVRLHHIGQPELTRAIAGVDKLISPTNATYVWKRVGASVDIGPLEAVTLAMFGYDEKSEADYDVLDSIPRDEFQCPECEAFPEEPEWPVIHRPGCSMSDWQPA